MRIILAASITSPDVLNAKLALLAELKKTAQISYLSNNTLT